MRLPRTLAAVVLLPLLVACGTETDSAPERRAVAEAPEPAGPDLVPEDYPLDAGLFSGGDVTLEGPGPRVRGVPVADMVCGSTAWPGPAEQRTDRRAVLASGPEYAEIRELVVFDTAEHAAAALEALRADVAGCPGTGQRVLTAHEVDTGRDAVTLGETYTEGLGGTAVQVVREGRAVLAVMDAGEFSPESLADFVPELTAETARVARQLDCVWGAGCAEEPVVLTGETAGRLVLGAGIADLRAAAPAVALEVPGGGQCATVRWTSPSGVDLVGAVDPDRGLAFVSGGAGVVTDAGVTVGTTLAELRQRHPEARLADNGLWWVDRGAYDYSFGTTDDVVSDVAVVADEQSCVG